MAARIGLVTKGSFSVLCLSLAISCGGSQEASVEPPENDSGSREDGGSDSGRVDGPGPSPPPSAVPPGADAKPDPAPDGGLPPPPPREDPPNPAPTQFTLARVFGGRPLAMTGDGSRLYVPIGLGVLVYDVTVAPPKRLGLVRSTEGRQIEYALPCGGALFTSEGTDLVAYDISSLESPRRLSSLGSATHQFNRMACLGDTLAVIRSFELDYYDVKDATAPRKTLTQKDHWPAAVYDVRKVGSTLYVFTDEGFSVYDLARPTAPPRLFTTASNFLPPRFGLENSRGYAFKENFLYALGSQTEEEPSNVVSVFDVSNPAQVSFVKTWNVDQLAPVAGKNPPLLGMHLESERLVIYRDEDVLVFSLQGFDPTGSSPPPLLGRAMSIGATAASTIVSSNSRVYVLGADGHLKGFSLHGGHQAEALFELGLDSTIRSATSLRAIGRDLLYVGASVLDVADPVEPKPLSVLPTRARLFGLDEERPLIYEASNLNEINLADPRAPKVGAPLLRLSGITGAAFDGGRNMIYVGSSSGTVSLYSPSPIARPMPLAQLPLGSPASLIRLRGDHILVGGGDSLVSVRIADSAMPAISQRIPTPGFKTFVVQETVAYVLQEGALSFIDITRPESMSKLGETPIEGGVSLDVSGARAYVGLGPNGVAVVDVADARQAKVLQRLETGAPVHGVAFQNSALFAGQAHLGTAIFLAR